MKEVFATPEDVFLKEIERSLLWKFSEVRNSSVWRRHFHIFREQWKNTSSLQVFPPRIPQAVMKKWWRVYISCPPSVSNAWNAKKPRCYERFELSWQEAGRCLKSRRICPIIRLLINQFSKFTQFRFSIFIAACILLNMAPYLLMLCTVCPYW